ncbi:MAG: GGDEF domain-containing protein [Terriglobales bacterium]
MQELNNQELQTLRKDIDSVTGRFSHLLSITILVMLALAAGIVLRALPRLGWNPQNMEFEGHNIPQLLGGLLLLIVLLSLYVLDQRQRLKRTQRQLIQELIRRETAERLAVIDPLTELYNRRYMAQAVAREAARADRQDSRVAFLMIDVNDFKQVNDSLGHMVGDRILQEVAAVLQKTFRTSDVISRYGGDEFLVLLVDVDQEKAAYAVERLQNAVAAWNRGNPITGYTMALSCGTALCECGVDSTGALVAADQAMYQAKHGAFLTASQAN